MKIRKKITICEKKMKQNDEKASTPSKLKNKNKN